MWIHIKEKERHNNYNNINNQNWRNKREEEQDYIQLLYIHLSNLERDPIFYLSIPYIWQQQSLLEYQDWKLHAHIITQNVFE